MTRAARAMPGPLARPVHLPQDRAYLTATEWKQEWGGHKASAAGVPFKSLPFHCCAISFQPFEDAVSMGRGPWAGAVAEPMVLRGTGCLVGYGAVWRRREGALTPRQ